jgi:hypothetical protein
MPRRAEACEASRGEVTEACEASRGEVTKVSRRAAVVHPVCGDVQFLVIAIHSLFTFQCPTRPHAFTTITHTSSKHRACSHFHGISHSNLCPTQPHSGPEANSRSYFCNFGFCVSAGSLFEAVCVPFLRRRKPTRCYFSPPLLQIYCLCFSSDADTRF